LNIGHIGQMIGRLGVMLRGGSIATILPAFRALFNGAMGTDITAYTPDIGGGAFSYTGDNTGTLKLDGSGNIITTTTTSLPAAAFYTLPANPSRITLTPTTEQLLAVVGATRLQAVTYLVQELRKL